MTSSTRSRKVIKQEEEEQTEGDPNGLAAAQEALSPRPQTSLLSLPDDLLLLIYEELYEDQYGDKNISPPVSEILVNKRIFNLARPIWFSRMTIDSSQLDQRLTGILRDEARRQDLRQLALSLEKSYANLIQFTLSSIPRLAHLRIQHDGGGSAKAFQLLVDYLSTSVCLDHVTLNSRASGLIVGNALSRRIDDAINSSANPPSFTVAQNGSPYSIHGRRRSYWWGIWPPGGDFNTLPCWHFKTFKQGLCMRGAIAREVIESLQTVARSLSDAQLNTQSVLHKVVLPIYFPTPADRTNNRYFISSNFTELLESLAYFKTEDLEFTDLNWIPLIVGEFQIHSISHLGLSGSVDLQDKDTFTSFFRLLNAFPSLSRLSLVGSSFFGPDTTADSLSKHSSFPLFLFPELATLLLHLRTTQIKTFTFRALGEKREMRWWRSTNEEDFEKDCWTL